MLDFEDKRNYTLRSPPHTLIQTTEFCPLTFSRKEQLQKSHSNSPNQIAELQPPFLKLSTRNGVEPQEKIDSFTHSPNREDQNKNEIAVEKSVKSDHKRGLDKNTIA
jgi:hypothetical protein